MAERTVELEEDLLTPTLYHYSDLHWGSHGIIRVCRSSEKISWTVHRISNAWICVAVCRIGRSMIKPFLFEHRP